MDAAAGAADRKVGTYRTMRTGVSDPGYREARSAETRVLQKKEAGYGDPALQPGLPRSGTRASAASP